MAEVAEGRADKLVITSDNPRTEPPDAIIKDILAGGVTPTLVEPDRRVAIEATIAGAEPGDTILIAGKGHEDYQILGTEKVYFSDQEVAAAALLRRLRSVE
jgi:UDP-N-acetylmuramoyl-L-alanyl-D-glutamate--2,6-diaminopimelate ligase